jgi:hypothetical protein
VFGHIIVGKSQCTQFTACHKIGNPDVQISVGKTLRRSLKRCNPVDNGLFADDPDNEQAEQRERSQDEQIMSKGSVCLGHDCFFRNTDADNPGIGDDPCRRNGLQDDQKEQVDPEWQGKKFLHDRAPQSYINPWLTKLVNCSSPMMM